MSEGFWNRPPAPNYASPAAVKRPRPDFDAYPPGDNSSHVLVHYPQQQRNDAQLGLHVVQDTKTIGASYDRYLQAMQAPTFAAGAATNLAGVGFPMVGEVPSAGGPQMPNTEDPTIVVAPAVVPVPVPDARSINFDGQIRADPMNRPEPQAPAMQLPPDATGTLYVEGLPRDCIEREVAHIFRPFMGFKEVRLVVKEAKYHGGSSILLCFVDFTDAAYAMNAMVSLQGYRMDLQDPDSSYLRIQFARNPGPRSGPGLRARR